MKNLKHLLLTMILAVFMAQPAMAGVLDDDMAFAFGNSPAASSDLGEMALLSDQEIVATEGALGPWGAVGGAGIGAISNIGYQLGSNSGWNWGSFGTAVGLGAMTGFTGGAAAWYVVPRVAFSGSFGAGRMGW